MTENKAAAFCSWFKSQDSATRIRVRDSFLERSGMSYASWYPKVRGKSFSLLQVNLLEDITGKTF